MEEEGVGEVEEGEGVTVSSDEYYSSLLLSRPLGSSDLYGARCLVFLELRNWQKVVLCCFCCLSDWSGLRIDSSPHWTGHV